MAMNGLKSSDFFHIDIEPLLGAGAVVGVVLPMTLSISRFPSGSREGGVKRGGVQDAVGSGLSCNCRSGERVGWAARRDDPGTVRGAGAVGCQGGRAGGLDADGLDAEGLEEGVELVHGLVNLLASETQEEGERMGMDEMADWGTGETTLGSTAVEVGVWVFPQTQGFTRMPIKSRDGVDRDRASGEWKSNGEFDGREARESQEALELRDTFTMVRRLRRTRRERIP